MLHITPQARSELQAMLMRVTAKEPGSNGAGLGLRLVASASEESGTQVGLTLDGPREDDEIVNHEGHSLLLLDPRTSELVAHLTLDLIETTEGTRLGLRD